MGPTGIPARPASHLGPAPIPPRPAIGPAPHPSGQAPFPTLPPHVIPAKPLTPEEFYREKMRLQGSDQRRPAPPERYANIRLTE